jgi:threonine synthase
MDIQIPSSLERLIYDLQGDTTAFYTLLQNESKASLDPKAFHILKNIFSSSSYDNEMILDEIKIFYKKYKLVIDPHTATSLSDNVTFSSNLPVVGIATASPGKFENVITNVIPEFHSKAGKNDEKYIILESDVVLVENTIAEYF